MISHCKDTKSQKGKVSKSVQECPRVSKTAIFFQNESKRAKKVRKRRKKGDLDIAKM